MIKKKVFNLKKIFNRKLYTIILFMFSILLPVIFIHAEDDCTTSGKICNPLPNITSLEGFIKTILEGVIKIGIPIIALAIIYSGFLFVEARGNSEKITKAKDALIYTLIGAAILLGSWAIAQLISDTVLSL